MCLLIVQNNPQTDRSGETQIWTSTVITKQFAYVLSLGLTHFMLLDAFHFAHWERLINSLPCWVSRISLFKASRRNVSSKSPDNPKLSGARLSNHGTESSKALRLFQIDDVVQWMRIRSFWYFLLIDISYLGFKFLISEFSDVGSSGQCEMLRGQRRSNQQKRNRVTKEKSWPPNCNVLKNRGFQLLGLIRSSRCHSLVISGHQYQLEDPGQ